MNQSMKRVERQRLELKEHREQFLFIELIVNTFTICLLWLTVMSVIDIGERKHAGNILLILFIFSQENVFLNTKHPPLHSPQKKNQKTVSGDPKNYHLGCLGYLKQHQTKSFECKILIKVIFFAKIKHFLAYLAFFLFIWLPKLQKISEKCRDT